MRVVYFTILVLCLLAPVIILPVSADVIFPVEDYCFQLTNISQYPDYVFIVYPSTIETGYTIIGEGECYRLKHSDPSPSLYAVKKIEFERTHIGDNENARSLNVNSAPFIPSDYSFNTFDINTPSQTLNLQEVREDYNIESIDNSHLFVKVTGCTYYYKDGTSKFFSYNSTTSRPNRYQYVCWWPGCPGHPVTSTPTIPTTITPATPVNTTCSHTIMVYKGFHGVRSAPLANAPVRIYGAYEYGTGKGFNVNDIVTSGTTGSNGEYVLSIPPDALNRWSYFYILVNPWPSEWYFGGSTSSSALDLGLDGPSFDRDHVCGGRSEVWVSSTPMCSFEVKVLGLNSLPPSGSFPPDVLRLPGVDATLFGSHEHGSYDVGNVIDKCTTGQSGVCYFFIPETALSAWTHFHVFTRATSSYKPYRQWGPGEIYDNNAENGAIVELDASNMCGAGHGAQFWFISNSEPTTITLTTPVNTTSMITPTVTISPVNTSVVTPVATPITQSAWLIPSVIAGIVIAGILLVRRNKGL